MHPILNHETQIEPVMKLTPSPCSRCIDLCGCGLLGLGTPGLGGLVGLDGALALADSGGTGNGVLAEVWAVAALGGGVDDGGEGPAWC